MRGVAPPAALLKHEDADDEFFLFFLSLAPDDILGAYACLRAEPKESRDAEQIGVDEPRVDD